MTTVKVFSGSRIDMLNFYAFAASLGINVDLQVNAATPNVERCEEHCRVGDETNPNLAALEAWATEKTDPPRGITVQTLTFE